MRRHNVLFLVSAGSGAQINMIRDQVVGEMGNTSYCHVDTYLKIYFMVKGMPIVKN